jgi:hypothetical protein
MLFRFEMGLKFPGTSLSRPGFLRRGVTDAVLKRDGNVPSRNDMAAYLAINGANTSEHDFNSDVGMASMLEDLAGIEPSIFLTSSTEGGLRSLRVGPE